MKRIYLVNKDKKRRFFFKKNELNTLNIKSFLFISHETKLFFNFLNINTKKNKIKNRCVKSGIATYVNRFFKLGRMVLKENMSLAKINSLRKASW